MELRPRYKQTEVGVIPETWDHANLGDKTVKVGSGITPTGGARVYKQSGRPFLRSQNIGWGSLLMDDVAFIDDQIHESFKATEIEAGDVFLNITGASIGRSAVADTRVRHGNVNQHVCIIRPKTEELDARFLNYFLLSTAGQRQIDSFQAGGNRQGINFGQIRSIRLPLPRLPEQRAISAALSDVDALLGALTQLIAKKRDLKQAAMQQLLTGRQRLPGFSGEWEVINMAEKAVLKARIGWQGLTTEEYRRTGEYLLVTGTDFSNGRVNWSSCWYVDRLRYVQDRNIRLAEGDILLTKDGTIGKVGFVDSLPSPATLNSGVFVIRPKSRAYVPQFLYRRTSLTSS